MQRLYKYLEEFAMLYEQQFGFRSQYSAEHALIAMTQQIQEASDSDRYACGVFLDLQKAFDTVNHEILISKLKFYGIKDIPLKWFESYLNQREQYVSINEKMSTNMFLTHGVPQGSVHGPLLSLMHIYDIDDKVE